MLILRVASSLRRTFSASLFPMDGLTFPRHSLRKSMPYISSRSAGPLISKFRKNVFARNRDKTSSRGSYDSLSGSTSRSDVSGGRAGKVYAGPRVRVRRGRRAKLPDLVSHICRPTVPCKRPGRPGGCGLTYHSDILVLKEYRVVGLRHY